ncbi:fungal-specific transcription factor domain-containing protein [Chlamydoabsidia padenii]|nr:fungal-specific transcription factor domain-containing protein [Chlamydoabsidia padenii]
MDNSAPTKKRESTKKTDSSTDKRGKRYKVGRACYSCRIKKIKCDGLQPCMQCKARQLPCTFSVDGVMDKDDITANETSTTTSKLTTSTHPARFTDNQPQTSVKQTIRSSIDTHQQLFETTIKTLDQLCTTWPTDEQVWHIDEQQLLEPDTTINNNSTLSQLLAPPPASISCHHRHLPPKKIQRQLIQLYYQHKYPLFHTIPQDLFLEHFEHQDSSISPLLLFAMYTHAAAVISTNVIEGEEKANDYFNMAKDILDSLLHVPCLSTIVALCLMALYEPKHDVDHHHSKSLLYGAIAFRMCNQLGYGQQQIKSIPGDPDGQILELRKRVVWSCYCLDKITSIYLGDPWMTRLQDIMVDLPRCFWPNEDQEQMECFVAFIKLMQMAEQSLKPVEGSFMNHQQHQSVHEESYAQQSDNNLTQWLQVLPLHLHWTPLPSSSSSSNVSSITTTTTTLSPPRNAWIAHLHLLFNMIQHRILLPFASRSSHILHLRCLSVTDNLTQITRHLSEQPDSILSFALTGTAIKMTTRVYLLNCGNQDKRIAMHTRCMLKSGLESLSTLLQQEQRSIPGMDSFLSRVNGALQLASKQQSIRGSAQTSSINPDITNNNIFLTGSELSATDILSQAFGASPPTSSSSSSSSTPLWHPSQNNNVTDHIYQPSPPSSSSPSSQQQQQQQQQQYQVDPFDFLESPSVLDQVWNQRMAPSSVDALLYKSRFSMEDQRQQYNSTNGSGGLLMSHAKLNDCNWMMRHTTKWEMDMSTSTTKANDTSFFWPLEQQDQQSLFTPPAAEKKTQANTTTSRGQQYMNIGLGVYASAHQHHHDVIRQRMP